MRSRSVVAGYALAVVFAAVFAFLFVRAADAIDPVWNEGWQLRVDGEAVPRVSAPEVYRQLDELAVTRGLDVVRVVADDEHPATVRHLFAAGDGRAGEWLRDGYRSVDPAMTTTVEPLVDLDRRDVRGMYLVGDDRSDAEAVLAVIERAGWDGDVHPYAAATDLDTYREHGDLTRAEAVAFLAVLLLVGAGTVMRGRAHGVQRLLGAGLPRILARELRALVVPVVAVAIAGLVVVVAAVAALNSLAQLPSMLALFGRMLAILLPAALATHVVAILLTDGRRLVDQVKGEIDGWWVLVAAYAVRLPAVFVLLAIVAALGQTARVAQVEATTREFWSTAGDAVTLGIAGYRSEDELRGSILELSALVRSQDEAGELVLASRDYWGDGETFFVNEGYLARVEVIDSEGRRITEVPDGALTVLTPDGVDDNRRQRATAEIEDFLFMQSRIENGVPSTADLPVIERAISRQTVSTFRSSQAGWNTLDTSIDDPIIAVLPSISAMAPSEIFADITVGAVVFTDPGAVSREIEARHLGEAVASVVPVAYQANEQYRRALGTLSLNVLGLIAAVLVVLLTGLVTAAVAVEKDRQRAFVHHLSGLPPLSAHRSALLIEGVLLAGVTALAVVPLWFRDPKDVRTVLDLAGADSHVVLAEQSALGLAATAGSAVLFVVCLAFAHTRSARARPHDS